MVQDLKCEICGRSAQKGILKGESFHSRKCPLYRRDFSFRQRRGRGRRAKSGISEFGKELLEKQITRKLYKVSERQFKGYVKDILEKKAGVEDASSELVRKLEKRLDNVVFRLGLAVSRPQARQLVVHSHFLVNGKPVNIPSFQVKVGDVISLKNQKKDKIFFKRAEVALKKVQAPAWLKLDSQKMEGKVIGEPSIDEAGVPAEIASVFEFYSR